jgi:hypothetical protein
MKLTWSSAKNAKSYEIFWLKGSAYVKLASTKTRTYTVKNL